MRVGQFEEKGERRFGFSRSQKSKKGSVRIIAGGSIITMPLPYTATAATAV